MTTRTDPHTGPIRHSRPAHPGGTVSLTSAERFAAKVRARRRRRRGAAAVAVLLVAALVWLAAFSPWTSVRTIEVTGTGRVDSAAVAAAADHELGRAMLFARTDAIAADVRGEQPLVRAVEVTRRWPGTLRIAVTERQPVAAVPAGGKLRLVDGEGVTVDTVGTAAAVPKGLPRIEVNLSGPRATPALLACVRVERELPRDLAAKVRKLGAGSPDRVWLELEGGAKVEWGSAEQTPRKAEVVLALLDQKADVYDVRSPDNPALRGVDTD